MSLNENERTIAPAGLSLCCFSTRRLKKINDNFGHLFGSRAICRLADVLAFIAALSIPRAIRGDEFALVLPESTEEMRIVLRIVSAKVLANDTSSRLSPRVSAYPHTAAMANASKNCYRKRTRICTQKKQSGENALPRPIPAKNSQK